MDNLQTENQDIKQKLNKKEYEIQDFKNSNES